MLSGLVLALLCSACTTDIVQAPIPTPLDDLLKDKMASAAPDGSWQHYILADENLHAQIPNQDAQNPITAAKINLGKMLFFDTGIAQNAKDSSCYQTYSCATCHVPESGFLPGTIQGIADGAHGFGYQGDARSQLSFYDETDLDAQGVRPLTVMNVAYMTNTLWSGTFGAHGVNSGTEALWEHSPAEINHLGLEGLESQNIEGVALHRMSVNDHVLDDFGYRSLFDEAFPELDTASRYSTQMVSFALGAYLRSILTTQSPFQRYLKGEVNALTQAQKNGALLFFDQARCYKCHNGPALSSMNFHALGTKDLYELGGLNTDPDDPRNLGRGALTEVETDYYRFKVPQLYNLRDYATFFHGSSKHTLAEVLDYKIKAVSENQRVSQDQISPLFEPLSLSDNEKEELLDFLTNALYDANMQRYVPQEVPSGLCFPNNDARSRADLSCQ